MSAALVPGRMRREAVWSGGGNVLVLEGSRGGDVGEVGPV